MLDVQEKLRVGELVVHPAYGFCRIQRIEWSRSGDRNEECYVSFLAKSVMLERGTARAPGLPAQR